VGFNPKPRFGVEKLLDIKTARFYGKVFLGPQMGASEKLLDIKTARFYGKVFFEHPKGVQKIEIFFLDFYRSIKNLERVNFINEQKPNQPN